MLAVFYHDCDALVALFQTGSQHGGLRVDQFLDFYPDFGGNAVPFLLGEALSEQAGGKQQPAGKQKDAFHFSEIKRVSW